MFLFQKNNSKCVCRKYSKVACIVPINLRLCMYVCLLMSTSSDIFISTVLGKSTNPKETLISYLSLEGLVQRWN